MNYNILSYCIYAPITFYITIWVGRELHKTGRFFVCEMTGNNNTLADAINNSLLVGYYLLNLGYITIMINSWEEISTFTETLILLCNRVGTIVLTLGIIHYLNMLTLRIYHKNSS
jgi:hypothetical protein